MQRRREIASAPKRSAAEVWQTIRELLGDTLDRSSSIERADLDAALDPLDGVARMLILAGHLEGHPLVLVAGELWLEITTVSGGSALSLQENLNPVPGGAGASDWTLHVPQVEPMAKLVRTTVKGHDHLSADEPTAPPQSAAKASGGVDLDAVARWAREAA
ncbi:MAG TPA: hypothetical protein VGH58_01455 [Solirubrobacterales bacterium]